MFKRIIRQAVIHRPGKIKRLLKKYRKKQRRAMRKQRREMYGQ